MSLVIKFVECENDTPKVLDLLKFYWAEKLNLEIKNCTIKNTNTDEYKNK
mgnify:CR=1 FL=1